MLHGVQEWMQIIGFLLVYNMDKENSEDRNRIISGGTGYTPNISVKKAGRIVLYPVTLNELNELKNRGDGDTILNFFFCFVTAFVSFFISYLTCSFSSLYKELIFIFLSILFAILSVIALFLWIHTRKKYNKLYNEIINREDAS